jgi:hypothetical protein
VVSFFTKGSGKPHIQSVVFECLQLAHELRCHIEPIHLLREDPRIQAVDEASKNPNTDNWGIDIGSFMDLHKDFQFEVDLFADSGNKRLNKYVTEFYDPNAMAMDAFTIRWNFMAWVCPPVSLLSRVINRIRSSKCQGVLIVPNWPASSFCPLIFDAQGSCKCPFRFIKEFRPYILQHENCRNTPLFGYTQFSFFALFFDTI